MKRKAEGRKSLAKKKKKKTLVRFILRLHMYLIEGYIWVAERVRGTKLRFWRGVKLFF